MMDQQSYKQDFFSFVQSFVLLQKYYSVHVLVL